MTAGAVEHAGQLTIAAVLDFEEVRAGGPEIAAGAQSLDRRIRWVHIADSEHVEQFLEGGELVLTTAQSFRRSAAAMTEFLDQLEAAGAAGVVIELVDGNGVPDPLAAEVVRNATVGRDLPVVVLSHRIKFVRITELAHRSLLAQQLGRLERAREIHETYTQLSLERADVDTIVTRTAQLLGGPVVLEDVGHRVLAHAGEGSAAIVEHWAGLVAGGDGDGGHGGGVGGVGGGWGWFALPVGLRARRWGRLVVPGHGAGGVPGRGIGEVLGRGAGGVPGREFDAVGGDARAETDRANGAGVDVAASPDVEQIIERASQALTLTRMAESDERDLLLAAQSGFVREVMDSGLRDEPQARARARSLGFDPSTGVRFVPAVVRLDRDSATDPTWIQLWERALIREASEAARHLRVPVLSANLQSGMFGLVLALPAKGEESKHLERLFSALPQHELTWTISVARGSGSLVTAITRLDGAAQVAEVASTLDVRDRVFYRSSDVRLRGLLSVLRDDPRVRTFAEGELGALFDGGDDDMLDLLDLVLTHGGNKSAIARASFLSRPALYARFAKLEDRLGVSLDDAESRTALHVALLWWRMSR